MFDKIIAHYSQFPSFHSSDPKSYSFLSVPAGAASLTQVHYQCGQIMINLGHTAAAGVLGQAGVGQDHHEWESLEL